MSIFEEILQKISKKNLIFLRSSIDKTLFRSLRRDGQVLRHWNTTGIRSTVPYLSPWIPSEEEVLLFEKYIKSLKYTPKRALILGGTVKLRKLLFSLGIPYVIADQSSVMLIRTSRFLKEDVIEKEMWVKSNWLDLPFSDNYFDIILGDLVLMQFLPKEQNRFLLKVKNLLSDGGIFVTRVLTENPEVRKKSVKEIIQGIISEEENGNIVVNRIMSQLLSKYGDIKEGRTDRLKVIQILRDYKSETEQERVLVNKTIENWGLSYLDYSFLDEKSIEEKLYLHFSKLDKSFASDHKEAKWHPVLSAKK